MLLLLTITMVKKAYTAVAIVKPTARLLFSGPSRAFSTLLSRNVYL